MDNSKLSNAELIALVAKADNAYHNNDDPIMDDACYDALRREMIARKLEYKTVGAPLSDKKGFKKVQHSRLCPSLDNIMTFAELHTFVTNTMKDGVKSFIDEAKIDGLSITLRYQDGQFVLGATRGDGQVGEDVTANCLQIADIPQVIKMTGHVEIRGEVYMSKKTFMELNEALEENGKKLIANPRNGASGALRQHDPEETGRRKLSFFAYDIICDDDVSLLDSDRMNLLSDLGFSIAETTVTPVADTIEETVERLMARFEYHNTIRSDREYDVDGVVYKVNELAIREKMGFNSRTPLWAMAHKFDAEKVETTLEKVEFQIGRTNVLTPVGYVRPVGCGGVIISKCTLHNMEHISKLNLHIGDRIIIQRAGDVIPQLVGVVKHMDGAVVEAPVACPACGHAVIQDGVRHICSNNDCSGALAERVAHFVSRDIMNCVDVGGKLAHELVETGLVKHPFDVFALSEDSFIGIGKGVRQATKFVNGINQARKTTIRRVIASLCVDLVSLGSGKRMAEQYRTISNVLTALENQDQEILTALGNVKGGNLLAWATSENVAKLREFVETQLEVEELPMIDQNSVWNGKTVVITGKFSKMDRVEVTLTMEKLGAKVSDSVSKKTDCVIYGEKAGSKLKKATDLGVQVMTEEEWLKTVEE